MNNLPNKHLYAHFGRAGGPMITKRLMARITTLPRERTATKWLVLLNNRWRRVHLTDNFRTVGYVKGVDDCRITLEDK